MEELINGVRNEARLATRSADCLLTGLGKDGGPGIVTSRVVNDTRQV